MGTKRRDCRYWSLLSVKRERLGLYVTMEVHSPVTAYYSCNAFLDPPSQETIDGIEEERHEKE